MPPIASPNDPAVVPLALKMIEKGLFRGVDGNGPSARTTIARAVLGGAIISPKHTRLAISKVFTFNIFLMHDNIVLK